MADVVKAITANPIKNCDAVVKTGKTADNVFQTHSAPFCHPAVIEDIDDKYDDRFHTPPTVTTTG